MDLMFVKWIAAVLLFALTMFAVMPLFLCRTIGGQGSNRRLTRFISLLSCAGGGIFMGTCFLDLFPEVQEQMIVAFKLLDIKQTFPVAEFLLGFGFLLILVIEQMVLSFQPQGNEQLSLLTHQHEHIPDDVHVTHSNYGTITPNSGDVEPPTHSDPENPNTQSSLRSAILVLALSVHSLFEGLAIGLQTSTGSVTRIFVAVFIHKSVIAFTLGINLTRSRLNKCSLAWCVIVFAIMSPLGIVSGSIITDFSQGLGLTLASGILQGIAAGTFLYVTFFEIIPHEINSPDNKLLKVLFLILGYSGISLLILYL